MDDKLLERSSMAWCAVGAVLVFYGLYIAAVGVAEVMPVVPMVQGAVLVAVGVVGVKYARLDKAWLAVVILGVLNIIVDFAGIYFYWALPSVALATFSTFLGVAGIAYLFWCVMYYKLVYSKYRKGGERI